VGMSKNKDRIAKIKPKPASIQLLDRQLLSSDPAVRQIGWESIPRIQAPVEPLKDCIAACFDHQNWYVKAAAAEACCRCIQSKGAAEVVIKEVAGPRFAHEDAEVRRCAAQALVRITEDAQAPDAPKSIPLLTAEKASAEVAAQLRHQDPTIRALAVNTLSRMGFVAGDHIAKICALIVDPDVSVRNAVVHICDALGTASLKCIDQMFDNLRNPNKELRRSAVRAMHTLEQHSGAEVAAAVARQLAHCELVEDRRYILLMLQDLKELSAPHGKAFVGLLEDPDEGIRASAIRCLVCAGPTVTASSLKFVKRKLEHQDANIRRAAMDAMRQMAPISTAYAQSVGKLLQEEQPEPTPDAIRYKVAILYVLGGAAANADPFLENLAECLEDKDWDIRRAAVEALEDLGENASEAAAEVARRMLHFSPDVRRSAAECLGRMGIHAGPYAEYVEAMRETEEDEDVLLAVEAACERLTAAGALGRRRPESPPAPAEPDW